MMKNEISADNCIFDQKIVYCQLNKLELNQVAARRPAKAVAQFFFH